MSAPKQKYHEETHDVTVALNGTYSAGFTIPDWAIFIGLYLPAMDDGDIGLEVSLDGTNYYPLLDITDGADVVICASGSDPGFVDISDLVRFVPSTAYVRLTCAAQASGGVTAKLLLRG